MECNVLDAWVLGGSITGSLLEL